MAAPAWRNSRRFMVRLPSIVARWTTPWIEGVDPDRGEARHGIAGPFWQMPDRSGRRLGVSSRERPRAIPREAGGRTFCTSRGQRDRTAPRDHGHRHAANRRRLEGRSSRRRPPALAPFAEHEQTRTSNKENTPMRNMPDACRRGRHPCRRAGPRPESGPEPDRDPGPDGRPGPRHPEARQVGPERPDPSARPPPNAGRAIAGQAPRQRRPLRRRGRRRRPSELTLSQLGVQRATDPELKRFSERMIEEHTRMNNELRTLTAQKGMRMPEMVDVRSQFFAQSLAGLSGEEFDRATPRPSSSRTWRPSQRSRPRPSAGGSRREGHGRQGAAEHQVAPEDDQADRQEVHQGEGRRREQPGPDRRTSPNARSGDVAR